MKLIPLVLALIFLSSCKENKKTEEKAEEKIEEVKPIMAEKAYPEALVKVFEAHGGLQNWKAQKTLSFDKPGKSGVENYTIDIPTRKEKVLSGSIERGFNGKNVWVLDTENTFKGDAVFYNNLYFYFYAMPFVLADNGIIYGETESVTFEGKSYPGVKMSFNEGVGSSYKDEYFIHYNPETYKMEWLGYTVTYRSGEKSDKISWINYSDTQELSGLVLPKTLTWHKAEGLVIGEAQRTVNFENVKLTTEAKPASFYAKPEAAKVVTGKKQ
ncbi:hypothetical protein KO500_08765 [Cellulophaga baltica]|uniref:DUF6503 family protein n=1 Tax=Cellulophaga TaxID=104264 RepID=UPI001C0713F7|nr:MULTISPECIES: DUF6503 family protein [Cellulophaga]MBU2996525.1 hypothetical protein [Cellulophaga baltica]MDO6767919.1 DUF6503 family protein [Cellulophaga sp. 1_MG-2023]